MQFGDVEDGGVEVLVAAALVGADRPGLRQRQRRGVLTGVHAVPAGRARRHREQPPLARRAAARAERSVRPERVRGPTRREKTFRGAVHERALARARWRSARGTRGRPPSRDSRRRAKRSRSVRGLPSEVARKPTSGAKTPCDLIDVRRGRQRRRQRSIIAHFLPRLASRMRIASS